MVASVYVPENGGIRANTEKLFGRIPKNGRISVSTEKLSNRGEYGEKVKSVRALENCPDDYLKMVESV